MITFKNLSYRYPEVDRDALTDIDLEVADGDLLLVAGPSGGGKSTLLKSINGLIPHFYGGSMSGKVAVDELDTLTTSTRTLASKVGFVGQDPEHHSVVDRVEDDIAFTLENLGIQPKIMGKRVEEVLDALGLASLRARRLSTLSGGERQRVAIAGALVAMPSHLVLDEPTSQLDPQSAEEVIGTLLRLRDELGLAVVIAEHRLERVVQYCEQVCFIDQGRAISGPTGEVLADADIGPPLADLGRLMGWNPLPLTLRQARALAKDAQIDADPRNHRESPGDVLAEAQGLEVTINQRMILRDVDVRIRAGESIVIMGRNGSGKTSLLRTMAGFLTPSRGRVLRPTSVCMLPQNPERIFFLETLAAELKATLKGRGLKHFPDDVLERAAMLGILDLLDKHPRDLSGGQRTRAAIAVVAAGNPDLILLDEPTRGMDAANRRALVSQFDAWRHQGKALLLATHDMELAAEVADTVIILSEGRIAVEGPPHEVLIDSLTFSTQMAKVFGDRRLLTVSDVRKALSR